MCVLSLCCRGGDGLWLCERAVTGKSAGPSQWAGVSLGRRKRLRHGGTEGPAPRLIAPHSAHNNIRQWLPLTCNTIAAVIGLLWADRYSCDEPIMLITQQNLALHRPHPSTKTAKAALHRRVSVMHPDLPDGLMTSLALRLGHGHHCVAALGKSLQAPSWLAGC